MGMFDTIHFEQPIACVVCQAPILSTQTKAFECTLDNFRIGDCIGHAEEIHIVREGLYCDACHAYDQQFVYLAVYRGILVDIALDLPAAEAQLQASLVTETVARQVADAGMHDGLTLETLARLVYAGVQRCVLGTKLATDHEFVRAAVGAYGEHIVAGIDARDGMVAVEGWREGTATPADELIGELTALGVRHLVYTDISRDGMQTGINAPAYSHVAAVAGFPVVASGGVSTLADIHALGSLGDEVIEGVIAGRAIYEGAFTLPEALSAARGEA